jgi:hypothetical protein
MGTKQQVARFAKDDKFGEHALRVLSRCRYALEDFGVAERVV